MSNTQANLHNATDDIAAAQMLLGGPQWLMDLRSRALTEFGKVLWPTTSEEEWRRTSLTAFEFSAYRVGQATESSLTVNCEDAPAGLIFGSLAELSNSDETPTAVLSAVQSALERELLAADNRLQFWNLALLRDAAVVYVPRGVLVEQPIVVDFHFSGDEVLHTAHVVVVLEEGASASVAKRVRSTDDGEIMVVDAENITVGPNAGLKFTSLQRLNDESLVFSNSLGRLERDARLSRNEVQLGADFTKSRFACELAGAGADAALNGIYFPTDEQHVDLRTVQNHVAPRTSSRAYYRGAVLGESHSIYQGLISVSPEARGTDAYLTSRNLVLSEDARADSIPSLNIRTDDVKCSHGSTTGKIDENQVFYLQSRGYSREEARLLLIQGYFEDLITQTPEQFQAEIRDLVAARLENE